MAYDRSFREGGNPTFVQKALMSDSVVIDIENGMIAQRKNSVLRNVNLHVEKGQFFYVVGKTGSGKSSLLKTLYGELPLKEGKGTIAGFDLAKLKSRQIPFLRRKLGIVFQDFQLLPDRSVNQNLVFVMKATGWKDKKAMKARMEDVLEKVGLSDKGSSMPHELSGGEQQRVAIARALVNEPEIILADEPTGNLDPDTSENILHLLSDISMQGTAILMATHDTHLMDKYKSRTIRCEDGEVITE